MRMECPIVVGTWYFLEGKVVDPPMSQCLLGLFVPARSSLGVEYLLKR